MVSFEIVFIGETLFLRTLWAEKKFSIGKFIRNKTFFSLKKVSLDLLIKLSIKTNIPMTLEASIPASNVSDDPRKYTEPLEMLQPTEFFLNSFCLKIKKFSDYEKETLEALEIYALTGGNLSISVNFEITFYFY